MRFKKSSMILYNNALSLVKVLRIHAHFIWIQIRPPRKTGSDFSEKADTDPTFEKIKPRIRPFKNNPDPDPQPYWFCFINGLSM